MEIKEVRAIKEDFKNQYYRTMEDAGNHMAIGIGKNEAGEFTIVVRLTNDKCVDLLPTIYKSVEVDIQIISAIKAI